MKKLRIELLSLALVASGLLTASAPAQNLFNAVVATTRAMTNDTGGLSYSHYGNHEILRAAAASAGLTNLHGLRLVYNLTNDDLEVISGTNDMVLATPLTFVDNVSVARTNNTVIERLAWVFVGSDTNATGTLQATEYSHFNSSNQLTHFALTGRLQFATPASDTNAAAVYAGELNVGPFAAPDHDDDHGHNHDHR
ncbi:MAG TPA: hypothetical protein VG167_06580 [Verrucomicrobiae bacterium]|nr:hypothetical protein [Verrucomicrobiae bacterium]